MTNAQPQTWTDDDCETDWIPVYTEPVPAPAPVAQKAVKKRRGIILGAIAAITVGVIVALVAWGIQSLVHKSDSGQPEVSTVVQPPADDAVVATPEAPQPEASPATPPAAAWVVVDRPTSLVIRRGATVVLQADVIEEMAATEYVVPPKNGNPAWLNNVGTGVGTDMGTAWIVGHNIVGGTNDPFELLGNVRPGDTVEITNLSGGTVYLRVNDGMGDQPGVGVQTPPKFLANGEVNYVLDFENGAPGSVQLGSCSDDGTLNVLVNATLIK